MNYKNDLFFIVFLLIHSSNSLILSSSNSLMLSYFKHKFSCCIIKKTQKQNNTIPYSSKYLENIKYDNTVLFVPPVLYGKVVKVYDGDTITIASKLPFDDSPIYRFRVRLRDIDSPEIKGHTIIEKNLAIISRDALHEKIFDKIVRIENRGTEKWGRLLADVYYNDTHINKWMLENGYAVSYDGGTKNRPEEWDE